MVRSIRLVFRYDDDGVHLLRRVDLGKRPRPGLRLDEAPPDDAVVLELRTRTGAPLYRRRLLRAIPQEFEHRQDDGRGPLVRIPYARSRGAFSVVVPAPEHLAEPVASVVIMAGPAARLGQPALRLQPGTAARWRELVRAAVTDS